jgi:sugar lactone lactonase YvrE
MELKPASLHQHSIRRTLRSRLALQILVAALVAPGAAQMQIVPTIASIAGTGTAGYLGDGGQATAAQFNAPSGLVFDNAGNLYISDTANNRIRKIAVGTGFVSTVAGTGTAGFNGDGVATATQLNHPQGISVDQAGNVYIADSLNERVRELVVSTGMLTTVAGTGTAGFSGDSAAATLAKMDLPVAVVVDVSGNLYISDSNNNRIRQVLAATGAISTIAGSGAFGAGTGTFSGDNGLSTSATFSNPGALGFLQQGSTPSDLIVWDSGNHRLRDVGLIVYGSPTSYTSEFSGNGTAVAGGDGGYASQASYVSVTGVFSSQNGVYIVDSGAHEVRAINLTTDIISTVAGNGTSGFSGDGGVASNALLSSPSGIAGDGFGNLYITDAGNNRIRKLTVQYPIDFPPTNVGSTSATTTVYLSNVVDQTISSIAVPASAGGVQEFTVGTITGCVLDGTTTNTAGTVCQVPITFKPGFPGYREIPLQTVTANGNTNFGLRGVGVGPLASLTPAGTTAVPGLTNSTLYAGLFLGPGCAAQDFAGNLYICDTPHSYIKRVDAVTGAVTKFAGNGNYESPGLPGSSALSNSIGYPVSIVFDSANNMFFLDKENWAVYRIDAITNNITYVTLVNGSASISPLFLPQQLAMSRTGKFYVADAGNKRVRMINGQTGYISTIAGFDNHSTIGGGDGSLATATSLGAVYGVAVDPKDNLYIAETDHNRIWKVDATTGIIHLFAGTGTAGFSGDGGQALSAQFSSPESLALDVAGNLYVTDTGNLRIRRIDAATGLVSTIMGTGYVFAAGYPSAGFNYFSYSTPAPAITVNLFQPTGISIDPTGNLLVSDNGGNVYRANVSGAVLNYPTTQLPGGYDSADNPQGFSLINVGNAPLTLGTPTAGANPSLPTGAALDASSTCTQVSSSGAPVSLAAGTSCGIYNVDLTVQTIGTNTSTVTLQDNSLNAASTQTVTLIGNGASAANTVTTIQSVTWVPNGIDVTVYTDFDANGNPTSPRLDYGSIVTLTASVVHQAAGATQPIAGTVAFYVNGTALPGGGSIPVQNGVATFTTTNLPFGNDTFTATFTPANGSGFISSTTLSSYYLYAYQATPAVTVPNVHVVYDGQPHSTTCTPVRPELQCTLHYVNSSGVGVGTTPPSRASSYSVFGTVNSSNYNDTGTISNVLIVDHLRGSLTLSNLNAVYDGNPHAATVAVTPSTEASAVHTLYNGVQLAPSAAGVYQVNAYIDSTVSNYTGSVYGTLIISTGGSSVWIANQDSTVSHLSTAGAVLSTAGTANGTSTLGAIAIDSAGDAWSVVNGVNALTEVAPSGTLIGSYNGGGLNAPVSLAVDGLGQLWIANSNNTVTSFSNSGPALSPATGYQPGGLSTPSAIAIDQTGSVWIANAGSSTVSRVLGVAAPVIGPTVTALPTTTTGTRP